MESEKDEHQHEQEQQQITMKKSAPCHTQAQTHLHTVLYRIVS